MLRCIWTKILWKLHVEKLDGSRFTGPRRLKMAKIETFGDISRNVEIRAIWFSELRTVVIVASFCCKPLVFNVFRFRVIHWPRCPKILFWRPFVILWNNLIIFILWYQIPLISGHFLQFMKVKMSWGWASPSGRYSSQPQVELTVQKIIVRPSVRDIEISRLAHWIS